MRIRLPFLLAVLLLYIGGVAIVNARMGPIHRTWNGRGDAQAIRFSMPSGPLPGLPPGLLRHGWTFHYAFTCHHLEAPAHTGPNTYNRPTFVLHVFGASDGTGDVDNRGRGAGRHTFADGGPYRMTIQARPTCRWQVRAQTP